MEEKTAGTVRICQERHPEPVAARFCVMHEGKPVGGSIEMYQHAEDVSSAKIHFLKGVHEVRVQIYDNPEKLVGGRPVCLVVYSEKGVTEMGQFEGKDDRFILPGVCH